MPKIEPGYGIQSEVDLALRHLKPDLIARLVTSLRMAGMPGPTLLVLSNAFRPRLRSDSAGASGFPGPTGRR